MTKIVFLLTLFAVSAQASQFDLLKHHVDAMKPGDWYELPDTKIPLYADADLLAIEKKHGGASIRGNSGSKAVINTWNSAAFDGKRWWFYGGGHRNYGGNEVYEFDFRTLTWKRLTAPSPLTYKVTEDVTCPWPKSGPAVSHTYDGFVWNPKSQSVWLFRHTGFCNYHREHIKNPYKSKLWEFDPDTRQWTEHINSDIETMSFGYGSTVWNPVSERIVVMPKFNTPAARGPLEVDENGKFYKWGDKVMGVGSNNLVWNPDNNYPYYINRETIDYINTNKDPLGWPSRLVKLPQEVKRANLTEAGAVYHPGSKVFVYWTGNRNIWTWDPVSYEFKLFKNPDSQNAPVSTHSRVFGKWVYIPELDVFAGYNNHTAGVWLYKLPIDVTVQ